MSEALSHDQAARSRQTRNEQLLLWLVRVVGGLSGSREPSPELKGVEDGLGGGCRIVAHRRRNKKCRDDRNYRKTKINKRNLL